MLKPQKTIYLLFAIFIAQLNKCMDKSLTTQKSEQRMITLRLSNTDTYDIERWKIEESKLIYRYYSTNNSVFNPVKEISLPSLSCNINRKEIELFSKACDIQPGIEFNNYFASLPEDEKDILIVAAGTHDGQGNAKLDCLRLSSHLLDAYLARNLGSNALFFTNTHIRSKIDLIDCVEFLKRHIISHNSPNFSPEVMPEQSFIFRQLNAKKIISIPSILKNFPSNGCKRTILANLANESFPIINQKYLDENLRCVISAPNKHKTIIHFCIAGKNSTISYPIDHPDLIREKTIFSSSGNYLHITSRDEILRPRQDVFQLIKNERPEIKNINALISSTGEIFSVCFNDASTLMAVNTVPIGNSASFITFYDISTNLPIEVGRYSCNDIMLYPSMIFNKSNDRLTVIDTMNVRRKLIWFNISDLQNISEIYRLQMGFSENIIDFKFSPNGKQYAILTNNGIILAKEKENKITNTTPIDLFKFRWKMKSKMLYHENGLLAIVAHCRKNSTFYTALICSVTHKILFKSDLKANGLGFTNNDVIFFHDGHTEGLGSDDNPTCIKINLINPEDEIILNYLETKTSLSQLFLLCRLWQSYKHKQPLNIYEEGQTYKTFLSLPPKLQLIIKKAFPQLIIINNNKDFIDKGHEIIENITQPVKSLWDSFLDLLQRK